MHLQADYQQVPNLQSIQYLDSCYRLLHSLHLWDEHQLITDTLLRQQLMACASFLVAEGPCPRHCIGSRP